MVYRKGELSKSRIDRDWPYLVALPAERCTGHNYRTIRLFCTDLSLCDRGHYFYRHGIGYNAYCFAHLEHAQRFMARFGGELIKPKDRPRWPR